MQSPFYFTSTEFACKCKSRYCPGKTPEMNITLIQALNRIRQVYDKPIVITSGVRCQEHNKSVGGSLGSYHLRGMAVDIRPVFTNDLETLWDIVLKENSFTGVGNGKHRGFIHLDVRPGQRKVFNY